MTNPKILLISTATGGEIEFLTQNEYSDYLEISEKSNISSKMANIMKSFCSMLYLMKHIRKINQYDIVIAIGTNIAMSVLFLSRLGFIRAKKVVWWGFYFHSEKVINLYRRIRFLFETKRTVYVLFSKFEQELYQNVFGPNASSKVFQFGYWEKVESQDHEEEDYYFSGGYSNRHYLPLIKAFEESGHRLLVVASSLNKELLDLKPSENITILFDLPRDEFYNRMLLSKGVIIPLKHNTGASGQTVLIQAMFNRKLIITNDNEIMKEYIQDRYNGIIVEDIEKELPGRIDEIEKNPDIKLNYIENSYKTFVHQFSREACIEKTLTILQELQENES